MVVTHCARAVYTARVPVHGRLHGPTRPVRGHVHGPTARSRPCTQPCTHAYVYTAVTRPCTRHIHGCVHGQYTAVYTDGPCTQPVHGSVNVRVHGPRTRPVVYMAGRPIGPCTRSQTARYGRVRPITAVYTARSQPVHGSVYGRVRRPLHGRPTRAYVYAAVKRPCTHLSTRPVQSCTWQVGLYGRVHEPRWHVTAVGRVHGRNAPCTRSCTRPIQSRVHVRLQGQCTRPRTRAAHGRSVPSGNVYTAR